MRHISVGCVFQHRSVEMPEMTLNELADATHVHISNFPMGTITFDAKLVVRRSSVNCISIKILRNRGQNARYQNVRRYAEQNNCGGKHSDRGSLERTRWDALHRFR